MFYNYFEENGIFLRIFENLYLNICMFVMGVPVSSGCKSESLETYTALKEQKQSNYKTYMKRGLVVALSVIRR